MVLNAYCIRCLTLNVIQIPIFAMIFNRLCRLWLDSFYVNWNSREIISKWNGNIILNIMRKQKTEHRIHNVSKNRNHFDARIWTLCFYSWCGLEFFIFILFEKLTVCVWVHDDSGVGDAFLWNWFSKIFSCACFSAIIAV